MSESNGHGHLPEGATIATLEMLRAVNTKAVRVPKASQRAGTEVYVRIRPIRGPRYVAMLPPPPPESESWPSGTTEAELQERNRLHAAWVAGLSPEARASRKEAEDAVTFKILAEGLIDPKYTPEAGEVIADDADVIAIEILRFSDLLAKRDEPAPDPAGVGT